MKVLVVSSKFHPEYSGSGFRAQNTYLRLKKRFPIHFKVLCSSVTFERSKSYVHEGISIQRISRKLFKKKSNRKVINKICKTINYWIEALPTFWYLFCNKKDIELIHIFGNVNVTSAAVTFAKFFNKPIIAEVVNLVSNPDQSEPRIFSFITGKGYNRQTKLVCISPRLKENCLKAGYSEEQIWCRNNPIDEKKFFPNTESKKKLRIELLPFCESDKVLLHIAKFCDLKNQIFLVRVLKLLPEDYKLVLVGPIVTSGEFYETDKRYFESVKEIITEYDLQNRVFMKTGFIDEPENYINASDVFLFPSKREAFGTPVLEALACAIPCVTNNIPGVFDERISNGNNGYICELNESLWADRITKCNNFSKDKLLSNAKSIREQFSTEVIDSQYYDIMTRLVASK